MKTMRTFSPRVNCQGHTLSGEVEELQRRKAALSLELMSLEDASRSKKQGVRGAGAIPSNTEVG